FPLRRQNFARNVQKCSKVVQAPHRLAGVGCALTVTLAVPAPIACTITPANLHEPIMYRGSCDVSRQCQSGEAGMHDNPVESLKLGTGEDLTIVLVHGRTQSPQDMKVHAERLGLD